MRTAAESALAELLRQIYPDPEPWLTAEAFARAAHDDVAGLDDAALEDERLLSRLRRAIDPRPSAWLLERVSRLDQEAARRQQRRRR
jgi:hypothetical protein